MTKRNIEIDDNLQDYVNSAWEQVVETLNEWLDDNGDRDNEPDTPCLHNDLDYNGRIHEIVDGSVPIYTAEINDQFYLHGDKIEAAFDDAGIGDKNDGNWPSGWKAAAIYCYIEQEVAEKYRSEANDLVSEWWGLNRPAAVAAREIESGDFDGIVVSDTSEIPADYDGLVADINDHGNLTLYQCDGDPDNMEELDAIV